MAEIVVLERVAEIFASLLDADAALLQFLDLARSVAGSPWAAIYLRDETRGLFVRWAERPDTTKQHLPIAVVEKLLAGRAHTTLSLADPRFADTPAVKAGLAAKVERGLGLALRHQGVLVGVLGLGFSGPSEISAATLRMLTAIAGFPAAAIHHARTRELGERRAHLADVLRRFGERALAMVDVGQIHRLILETVVALTGSDQASITGVFGDEIRVLAGIGKDEALVGSSAPVKAMGGALSADEPFVVHDVAQADESLLLVKLARRQAAASFVVLAMRHQDRVLGHLFAGSAEAYRFRAEELEALRILASVSAALLEQRSAQAAAEREAWRLAATIEHLPIAIEVFGRHGGIVQANAAARALLDSLKIASATAEEPFPGHRVRHLDGRAISDGLPSSQALRGAHPAPCEIVVADADNARRATLLMAAAPIFGHERPGSESVVVESVVVGLQDVTKLYELAEAKDRFLRVASHELRTPITSLLATTQMLALDPTVLEDPERIKSMFARINRQSGRLVRLVEQLLDSARVNAGELPLQRVEVDLVQLCRDVIGLNMEGEGPHAVLHADGPVVGSWDPVRIEQVLTNLLSNAARYSPPRSEVIVNVSANAGRALVSISDHGMGIPAAQLNHLFTPFFRGSNAYARNAGGLGLGLHISQQIVRRHGGDIHVRSVENEGTTFVVELPRAAADAAG